MLDRDTNAVFLYAIDKSCTYPSCKERIFGIVFEVSTTKEIALYVHGWSKKYIDAIFLHLVTHSASHFCNQRWIPGGSEDGSRGECCRIITLWIAFAQSVYAESGRTISHDESRDAQSFYRLCYSSCTWYSAIYASCYRTIAVSCHTQTNTMHEFHLLIERHSCYNLLDICL